MSRSQWAGKWYRCAALAGGTCPQ